jgi:hypothetical protein
MRAILIDPFTRTVSDIDTAAGLDDLYEILQVDLITVMQVGASHAMILDDEGLLKDSSEQEYFQLKGMDQPLAGRGLILADEYGENRPATLSLNSVACATINYHPNARNRRHRNPRRARWSRLLLRDRAIQPQVT